MFKVKNSRPMLLTRTSLNEATEVGLTIVANVLVNDYSRSRIKALSARDDYTLIYLDCSEPYFDLIKEGLL